jgi:hypothetical protein
LDIAAIPDWAAEWRLAAQADIRSPDDERLEVDRKRSTAAGTLQPFPAALLNVG